MWKRFRYHIAVFFAVIGPGFITAMVDNDAGGILTYSQAGAKFGYLPLWTLLPITLLLIVTQEMCSRMGAVTGKGLSDLIREEFGLRITFITMAVLVLANLTNMIADFSGIAGSLEIFGIPRWVSVPLGAAVVWLLVVKGSYASVEKIFLFACLVYVAYIASAILVKPDWKQAAIYSVRPVLMLQGAYLYMLIGMVGTSIAPWMQFYLQAAVVEKGVTAKEYKESRIEVIVGCIAMSVIAFFIIDLRGCAPRSPDPRRCGHSAGAVRPIRETAIRRRLI
jgi:NRAMP (natural resistance-associated macrophage protein)-like metal ion transporter